MRSFHLFFLRLLLAGLSGVSLAAAAAEPALPRLVWAHYVGWGFDFAHQADEPDPGWRRLTDRSLSGSPWTSSDAGLSSTTRTQVLEAMRYGIDGFMVDVPLPQNYAATMARLYEAAEGLPFYIALCVDGWEGRPKEKIVGDLAAYFQRWGRHPNNYFIDGKPVVFIYKTSLPPEECAQIVAALKDRGYEAYWLVQPQRENTPWGDENLLDRYLRVFDGLYDFGSNGISLQEMKARLENGRRALVRAGRPGQGVLVAGITQGYNGTHNAFYRPFFGTGTFRENWDAARAAGADWVALTTWNDYIENTHFEPSAWGRDTLLRINREYAGEWRLGTEREGESERGGVVVGTPKVRGPAASPVAARPPAVYASYKNEVRLGDQWTLEIQAFPYTTAESFCHIRLTDEGGNPVRVFPPIPLSRDQPTLSVQRLENPGIDTPRVLRMHAAVVAGSTCPPDGDEAWRELYPVVVRPGAMRDYQTLRVAMDELLPTPDLTLTDEDGKLVFRSGFEAWNWVGTAELLRNGRVIESRAIAKEKSPRTVAEFTLPASSQDHPLDLYVVRFTRADGKYAWSRPVLRRPAAMAGSAVSFPVLKRPGDFDECWGLQAAAESVPSLVSLNVPSDEVSGFFLPMEEADARQPREASGWRVAAVGGGGRWGKSDPEAVPQVGQDTPPAGRSRYFSFDGKKSRILLAPHALPHDVLTVEAQLRPGRQSEAGYVLSDQNRALDLGVTAEGKLFAQRGQDRVVSTRPLDPGEWTRVAAVYDGTALRLYLNGEPAGERAVPASVCPLNSLPAIGCKHEEYLRFSHYYQGDIAGLRVTGRPFTPEELRSSSL